MAAYPPEFTDLEKDIFDTFIWRVFDDKMERLQAYIAQDSNVNLQDASGNTLMHYAVRYYSQYIPETYMKELKKLLKLLLSANADPSIKNNDGETVYDLAESGFSPSLARFIKNERLSALSVQASQSANKNILVQNFEFTAIMER